jgi:hypothetical protein
MPTAAKFGVLAMVILLAHAAVGGAALGADDPADDLLRRGTELRKNERHEEALDLFRKAHAISPSGRTLAQMGLAEFSLRAYVEAEAHLVGALADGSSWIAKNRGVLEQALADVRKHVAVVAISGPAGTEVSVSGKVVGRLPLTEPVHVAEGTVRVEGTALGHQPAILDLRLEGGREFKAALEMVAVPSSPSPPPPTIAPISALTAIPAKEGSGQWQPWVGSGLLAVSAAALATGIVWIAVDGNPACDIPSSAPAGSRCLNYYDTKALGWIVAGAGVAAGVVGGVLIWKGRDGDLKVGVGPGSLTAIGRF